MRIKKHKNTVTCQLRMMRGQIEYWRNLMYNYGHDIARNYFRLINSPKYWNQNRKHPRKSKSAPRTHHLGSLHHGTWQISKGSNLY